MGVSREDRKGWIGSLLVHGMVGMVLFFWRIDQSMTQPEFINVSWGTLSSVQIPPVPSPSPGSAGNSPSVPTAERTSVDLPKRQPVPDEDVLPVARSKKLEVDDVPQPSRVRLSESAQGLKGNGIGAGEKERFGGQGGVGDIGKIPGVSGLGKEGSGVGKAVAFSMEWSDGGNRLLLSGNLPRYPDGVNVEAQIKLESVVLPGGGVKSLKPVQKGNTQLEEAAMNEVRHWMFEPLPKSTPQRDQSCVITFNFTLR